MKVGARIYKIGSNVVQDTEQKNVKICYSDASLLDVTAMEVRHE